MVGVGQFYPVGVGQFITAGNISAPDQIWTDLSKGLELLGGVFVLRGIPENSFKLLAEKVLHLQQVGVRAPILIDPLLFSQNNVEAIPTFLIVEGDKVDKISGNLSLSYVIEKMSMKQSLRSKR